MTTGERALRADARRNRDAVLAAARAVFAERGLDAPLDAIARRARVGRATLYRRFPTRDDLVRAIFDDNLAALDGLADELRDDDAAFFGLLEATAAMLADDRGFVDLLALRPPADIARDVTERFLAIVEDPLRRAQDAGLVRADFPLDDTLLLVDMVGGAALGATAAGRPRPRGGAHRAALDLLVVALTPPRGNP